MRVEQEQKVTEDARIFAEQDAAAQRYASHMLEVNFIFFCFFSFPGRLMSYSIADLQSNVSSQLANVHG